MYLTLSGCYSNSHREHDSNKNAVFPRSKGVVSRKSKLDFCSTSVNYSVKVHNNDKNSYFAWCLECSKHSPACHRVFSARGDYLLFQTRSEGICYRSGLKA